MAGIDHRVAVATRKMGDIPNFVWFAWECLDDADGGVMLTGCVSSGLVTKGKRKGRPRYDGERKRVVVTDAEWLAEKERFERETGKCSECGGDGKVLVRWDHIAGTTYGACFQCKGTGSLPGLTVTGSTDVEGIATATESGTDSTPGASDCTALTDS